MTKSTMRTYLALIMLFSFCLLGKAQEVQFNTAKINQDLSQFAVVDKTQSWVLENFGLDKQFTYVQFRITINNNRGGSFTIPSSTCLYGDFPTVNAIAVFVANKQWALDKSWSYGASNKGRSVEVVVVFPRIPAGFEKFSYLEPNFINWENILIDNPGIEHTDWTEDQLISHWESNGNDSIEGTYLFVQTNNKEWWGDRKHLVAIVKNGRTYNMIYLKGSDDKIWKEGDLKAVLSPTSVPNMYKATTWYMENKTENVDFFMSFDNQTMYVIENEHNVRSNFLKMYPTNQKESTPIMVQSEDKQTEIPLDVKASGSGIMISENGVIATNYHVIEGAKEIYASISDGKKVKNYKVNVLASDKNNDLALLQVLDDSFIPLAPIPYSISYQVLDVGTSIFTMGYPMAQFLGQEVKVTDGIINSKTGYQGDIVTYQISAPIQPGNSGGALFDKKGHLIGITNAGVMDANNVGYAIKSVYLCNLIDSAPIKINIPTNNELSDKELPEQIKILQKYVAYITIK